MAKTVDFTIDQGATWNRRVTLTNDDHSPVDLTGFTARMMLKRQKDDPVASLSLTLGSGLTITPLTGQIDIEITAQKSDKLTREYYYDLELVSGLQVIRLFQGKILIDQGVTR